jgi:hypothetical protein
LTFSGRVCYFVVVSLRDRPTFERQKPEQLQS